MNRIEKFEDLIAWQKARELTREIYRISRETRLSDDLGLARQMQRATVSIMSNLAEGQERGSATDYHHFVVIAKASCAELRSQLYVAFDAGYVDPPQFEALMTRASEVARIVGGLRASLAKRKAHPLGD
jgi:four helix bundle protein